jgi:Cdc6-like AAA superfamily ATPase
MPFDISSQEETRKYTVDKLSGNDLQEEVRNQAKQLEELVASDHFTQRGALLVVEGSWGAGKTTVTWALINLLEEKLKESGNAPVFIFKNQSSLLPFGSSSESIRVFLTGLAQDLWEENLFDVRKDIQRSILEVAPPEDGQYNVSTHLGPLNVSKNIGQSLFVFQNSERIKAKFRSLAKSNGIVILVLDDIDRLRPNEIVSKYLAY